MKMDEKDQEYDQFVRELAFEKRAKPKDRTKTEEEIALEEKSALEKAERKRIRRMNGEDWNSDEEGEEDGNRKGKRHERGGDDLDDDFMEDETYVGGLGAGLKDVDAGGSEDGTEESDEGDEDEGTGESDEDEQGTEGEPLVVSDDGSEDDEDDGEEPEELVKSSKQTGKRVARTTELPFTFPCPSTHEEFLEIVGDIKESDVPTVVKRIRTLHHPSLAEDNKFKLQVCENCTRCCIVADSECDDAGSEWRTY